MRFADNQKPAIKNISYAEIQQMMKKRKPFTLIDVREKFERDNFNIGGLHIPLGDIPICEIDLPKDETIIVYCAHGFRSIVAAEYLTNTYGFTNVYNLKNGLHQWPK